MGLQSVGSWSWGYLEYLFIHLTLGLGRRRQLRAGIVGTVQVSLAFSVWSLLRTVLDRVYGG